MADKRKAAVHSKSRDVHTPHPYRLLLYCTPTRYINNINKQPRGHLHATVQYELRRRVAVEHDDRRARVRERRGAEAGLEPTHGIAVQGLKHKLRSSYRFDLHFHLDLRCSCLCSLTNKQQ
jgi:hypothetical protein